jgi:DNA-binding LacI/PurR family transcriptional regulator
MGTMKEIAKAAGVSLGTVSNVFSGSAPVRESLRRKVMAAVETTGFPPSQLARGLRRDKTNLLAIIIPDIRNPFFPDVVRGAEDVAFANGYRLVICNTDHDYEKELAHIKELRTYLPSGLVVITSNVSEFTSQAESLRKSGIEVVCVDCLPKGWSGDTLISANEQGAYDATRYLLKQGHTRLSMISGQQSFVSFRDRLKGFRRALDERSVEIDPDFIQESTPDSYGGYIKTMVLMKLIPRPTAIFAGNDIIAVGAMRAFRELGVRCPEDVSLIGFDDLAFSEMTHPPLTTVSQPAYQMGSVATRMLLDRIKGSDEPAKNMVLGTALRIRGSVAPLAKAKKTARSRTV